MHLKIYLILQNLLIFNRLNRQNLTLCGIDKIVKRTNEFIDLFRPYLSKIENSVAENFEELKVCINNHFEQRKQKLLSFEEKHTTIENDIKSYNGHVQSFNSTLIMSPKSKERYKESYREKLKHEIKLHVLSQLGRKVQGK